MHAMHVLEEKYGWEVLRKKRILLIHAGGYSQRTPTSSCLGKIATSIPKGWPCYDLFDLKLALYSLFPGRMPEGGVFLCSSDTIELFDEATEKIDWTLNEDFVAFAHRSSVTIGTQHGVYVLDPKSPEDCLCVLQKTVDRTNDETRSNSRRIRLHRQFVLFQHERCATLSENLSRRAENRMRNRLLRRFYVSVGPRAVATADVQRRIAIDSTETENLRRAARLCVESGEVQSLVVQSHRDERRVFGHLLCNGSIGRGDFLRVEIGEKHVACKVFDEERHDSIDFWHG